MEREVIQQGSTGESFENKPLEPFYNFSKTEKGTVLEGRYIGRFESKASGNPFHVFEKEDGTRFAAWNCTALQYKIQELLEKEKELGLPQGTLYMSTTFLGKMPGKKSYSFTKPTIWKPGAAPVQASQESPRLSQ